jgi:hypothetical protein
MEKQANTITIDGTSYDVSQFSQGIQNAVGIYNSINADLQREQLAALKSQAALQSIGAQIGEAVKKELAEKELGEHDEQEIVESAGPTAMAPPVAIE